MNDKGEQSVSAVPYGIWMHDVEDGGAGFLYLSFPRTDRVVLRITAQDGADEAAISLDLCRLIASLQCGQQWSRPPQYIPPDERHDPPLSAAYQGDEPLTFHPTARLIPVGAWNTLHTGEDETDLLAQLAQATGSSPEETLRRIVREAYAAWESELS